MKKSASIQLRTGLSLSAILSHKLEKNLEQTKAGLLVGQRYETLEQVGVALDGQSFSDHFSNLVAAKLAQLEQPPEED